MGMWHTLGPDALLELAPLQWLGRVQVAEAVSVFVGWCVAFGGKLIRQRTVPSIHVIEIVQTCHVEFKRIDK